MGSELGVWKTRRYVKGIRAKNAGISLTRPEIDLIDKECKFVTEKTGKPFTRTALVRYCLEEYFGDQWAGSIRAALHEKAEELGKTVPKRSRRSSLNGSVKTDSTDSPETTHSEEVDHAASVPEPVPSEVT